MPIKTIPIRATFIGPDGTVAAGAVVTATLVHSVTRQPIYDSQSTIGVVVPTTVPSARTPMSTVCRMVW